MKRIIPVVVALMLLCANINAKGVGGGFGFNVFEKGAGGNFLLWYTGDSKMGWFVSLNTNFQNKENRDDYYSSIDVVQAEDWGDDFKSSSTSFSSWSIGAMVKVYKGLAIYGGVGSGNKTEFLEYYDSSHILGDKGEYWIEGESERELNMAGGVMFDIPRTTWCIYAGGNTYPESFTAGAGFLLDW